MFNKVISSFEWAKDEYDSMANTILSVSSLSYLFTRVLLNIFNFMHVLVVVYEQSSFQLIQNIEYYNYRQERLTQSHFSSFIHLFPTY